MKIKNKKCKNLDCLSENIALPIEHFYKRTDTPDSLQYYCKECCKRLSSDNRDKKKKILEEASNGSWWLEQCFGGRK